MDAVSLVQRFAGAIAAQDESGARELCAEGAWHSAVNSVAKLYRQLTGQGRSWRLDIAGPARESESTRAVVPCEVVRQGGDSAGRILVLCDHLPRRIAGWTKSETVAQRFMTGLISASFGEHELAPDDDAEAGARAFAELLSQAAAGDDAARAELGQLGQRDDVEPQVIGYLQMRTSAGARLDIERALVMRALGRVAVEARLVDDAGPGERIWLYAEQGQDGQLLWRAHRTLFDADTLLAL